MKFLKSKKIKEKNNLRFFYPKFLKRTCALGKKHNTSEKNINCKKKLNYKKNKNKGKKNISGKKNLQHKRKKNKIQAKP